MPLKCSRELKKLCLVQTKEEFSPNNQKPIIYLVQIHHLLWVFCLFGQCVLPLLSTNVGFICKKGLCVASHWTKSVWTHGAHMSFRSSTMPPPQLRCVQNNFSVFFLEREIHLIVQRMKKIFIITDFEVPSSSLPILKFLWSFQKVMQSEYVHRNN